MSPRKWDLRIHDMIQACEEIIEFTKDLSLNEFKSSRLNFNATIRSFEVLGEASSHIPQEISAKYSSIPWRTMKNFRNILSHEYFGVDEKILWLTIQNHIPKLLHQLIEIRNQENI